MNVKQKDEASIAKFTKKLQDLAVKAGGVFVHYSSTDGVWIMKVEGF